MNTPAADHGTLQATSPSAKVNTKRLLLAGAIAILAALAAVTSLATLNGNWLKARLVDRAKTALNADLRLAEVQLSPFRGEATLSGLELDRHVPRSDLNVRLGKGTVELSVISLIFRKVHIERLELAAPQIVMLKTRPADTASSDTMEKLKRWASRPSRSSPRQRDDTAPEWCVDELIIRDGSFDYTSTEDGQPPFRAIASNVNYSASGIGRWSLYRLLYGADVQADLDFGQKARFEKRGTAVPPTCALTGVDMASLDRLFDQSDALTVAGGTMDFTYNFGEGGTAKVLLDGLQLSRNDQAANQQFLFIPVEKVIEFAERKQGRIELTLTDNADDFASEDLETLAEHFWTHVWIAILKEVSPESEKELLERGKAKAEEYFRTLKVKRKTPTATPASTPPEEMTDEGLLPSP